MSISSSIDITFQNKINVINFIKDLLDEGWSLDDNGHISYLPFEDDDAYDWQWLPLNHQSEIWSIIQAKQEAHEVIGIVITWEETGIGGEILFWNNSKSFSFNLTVNHKTISDKITCTDFSWYLNKIVPLFLNNNLHLENIGCEQVGF